MKKKIFMVLFCCIALLGLCGCGDNDTDDYESDSGKSKYKENRKIEKLEQILEDMGKDFYENYYYDYIHEHEDDPKDFLSEYSEIGIKIDLDNLVVYDSAIVQEKLDEFYSIVDEDECRSKETKAIIYPKAPYGKLDYKIDVIVECDFEDESVESEDKETEEIEENIEQSWNNDDNEKRKIEKLETILKDIGIDFYENYYYEGVGSDEESRKNFLQKYSEIGIKISLDNFLRDDSTFDQEKIDEFYSIVDADECSSYETKVIIYPKAPYGKKDYKIDVNLVCDFED